MALTDTVLVTKLLQRIAQQQVTNNPFFIKGSFPAYADKFHFGYSERLKDNNTSFCIVINTLQSVRSKLTVHQQSILDSISFNAKDVFKKFENKNGKGTYNFWRQDIDPKFPYNWWVPFFFGKSWYLPDDFDDTIWSFFAQNKDSAEAVKMHEYMQGFAQYPASRVVGCPPEYKSIPAYSTWFGKNFPVFYDLCVAANTLSFVQHYNLSWTKADSATLQFLVKAVSSKDYINKYKDLSPYYKNRAVIIYHLIKLMSIKPIPALEAYRVEILKDALKLYSTSNNLLEQLILATSMQRSGYNSPKLPLPKFKELVYTTEHSNLAFFTADMLGYFEGGTKKLLSAFFEKGLYFNCYCPAYNDALLVEYLVWQE